MDMSTTYSSSHSENYPTTLLGNKSEVNMTSLKFEISQGVTVTSVNVTPNGSIIENESTYLETLSSNMAVRLLPVILYLGILMVIGVFGNSLVLYVHLMKFTPSSTRTFVISLAVFDLLSCCIAMPGEIFDLRYSFTFYNVFLCKGMRLGATFASLVSGFTLVAVAVDRFRRICRPLKVQVSHKNALKIVFGACAMSLSLTWPVAIIYGIMTVDTDMPTVKGVECSTSDSVRDTKYPRLYTGVLFVVFLSAFLSMTVLYVFIGRRVFRQGEFRLSVSRNKQIVRSKSVSENNSIPHSPTVPSSPVDIDMPSYEEHPSEYSIGSEGVGRVLSRGPHRKSSTLKKFQKTARDSRTRKTTFMLFLISLVFVFSFLPHLILKAVRAFDKGFLSHASTAGLILYNIFVRSYFLNSVSNAFIYGFCSPRFRKESQALLTKLTAIKQCGKQSSRKSSVK